MIRATLVLTAAALALSAAPGAGTAAYADVLQQGQGKGQQGGARGGGEKGARPARQPERGRQGSASRAQERGRAAQDRPQADRGGRGQGSGRASAPGRDGAPGRARVERRSDRADDRRGGANAGNRSASARGRGASGAGLLSAAANRGRSRGAGADAFRVDRGGDRLRLLNRNGALLLDLDRDRDVGAWELRRMGDRRPNGNAPAFCRSGAGHPVWGREWCLDKGFGLGSRRGTLWSRGGVEDIIFRRRNEPIRLDRGGLVDILGDIVFGRMALQAVTLGYQEPLVGAWVSTPSSPQILRVYSGGYPVAEFVDVDRDDRVEVLYVVQPL